MYFDHIQIPSSVSAQVTASLYPLTAYPLLIFLRTIEYECNLCSPNALRYGSIPWSLISPPGVVLLMKTDFPSPSSYQLPIVSLSELGLHAYLSCPPLDFLWLGPAHILWMSQVWGVICAAALLCQENTLALTILLPSLL